MKTTKAIIGGLCLFYSFQAFNQEAQVDLLFYTDFNGAKKGITTSDLTIDIDNKFIDYFIEKSKDTSNITSYEYQHFSPPINDIFNKKRLIETNDNFIDPFDGDRVYPIVTNDSIFIYRKFKSKKTKKREDLLDESLSLKNINSIITAESWNYENGVFSKKSKINSILIKDNNRRPIQAFNYLIYSPSQKGELYKNITYNYLFPKENNDVYHKGFSDYERNRLLKSILKDIFNGKLQVYDLQNNKISIDNIDSLFINKLNYPKGISLALGLSSIKGIEFTENWYLAKNQFDIIKEVTSISFIVNDYNEKGEIIGTKKLPCIIKFKN